MTDLISIVTPSYNQCHFLRENIESLSSQDDTNFEHIVVDGGSTDGTIELLETISPGYTLRWISEEDDGQSEAINKGIDMAEGEWIAWLNADDYYYPRALAHMRRHMESDIDVLYGDFCFVDDQRNELFCQYNTLPSKLSERFWTRFAGNHCTLLRSGVFERIGKLNEELTYTMDADLFWRLLEAKDEFNLFHIPATIAARRLHDEAKTVGQSHDEMDVIHDEKKRIYGGYVPSSRLEKVLLSALGLAAKSGWMAYEAFHPEYPLPVRRMIKGLSSDYRRAVSAILVDER